MGVVINHRQTTNDNVPEAAGDVVEAIAYMRAHAPELGVDPSRLCIAFYSAGGPLSSVLLRDAQPYVRCVVLYYLFLDLEHMRGKTAFREAYPARFVDSLADYSPAAVITRSPDRLPPIFLARAGRDAIPNLNASIARFMQAAVEHNVTIDFVLHRTGEHGFDTRNPGPRTHEIIAMTMEFVRRHLGVEP